MADPSSNTAPDSLPVDLALQGGGAHGAFTWGVLDRLQEGTRPAHGRHLRDLRRGHERGGPERRLRRWADQAN
jgi:hypothetical protein